MGFPKSQKQGNRKHLQQNRVLVTRRCCIRCKRPRIFPKTTFPDQTARIHGKSQKIPTPSPVLKNLVRTTPLGCSAGQKQPVHPKTPNFSCEMPCPMCETFHRHSPNGHVVGTLQKSPPKVDFRPPQTTLDHPNKTTTSPTKKRPHLVSSLHVGHRTHTHQKKRTGLQTHRMLSRTSRKMVQNTTFWPLADPATTPGQTVRTPSSRSKTSKSPFPE
jgi:hypothetical protein